MVDHLSSIEEGVVEETGSKLLGWPSVVVSKKYICIQSVEENRIQSGIWTDCKHHSQLYKKNVLCSTISSSQIDQIHSLFLPQNCSDWHSFVIAVQLNATALCIFPFSHLWFPILGQALSVTATCHRHLVCCQQGTKCSPLLYFSQLLYPPPDFWYQILCHKSLGTQSSLLLFPSRPRWQWLKTSSSFSPSLLILPSSPLLFSVIFFSFRMQTVPSCQNLYKNAFTYFCPQVGEDGLLPLNDCVNFIGEDAVNRTGVALFKNTFLWTASN